MKDKFSWEETILEIRQLQEFDWLVKHSYLDSDLVLNVERFRQSKEYEETKRLIRKYSTGGVRVLDIGSGNGISSIALSLDGFEVTSVEPDPSHIVGIGAIQYLKSYYNLSGLDTVQSIAENLDLGDKVFDIIYARQCLHHANNLDNFVLNTSKYLKKNGVFITVRDHVIFSSTDKELFLRSHPLQKYYGGENAFKACEYRRALTKSGLIIKEELKFYDSVINFSPDTLESLKEKKNAFYKNCRISFLSKFKFLSKIPFIMNIYSLYLGIKFRKNFMESAIPGRMYSYISIKK